MPEKPKRHFPKKFLIISVALIIVLLLVVILGSLVFGDEDKPGIKKVVDKIFETLSGDSSQDKTLTKLGGTSKCEGSGPVTLTHLPMDPEDFGIVLPYGLMVGAHVTPIDHMYFAPASRTSQRDEYEVYAMADGILSDITTRGINVDTGEKRPVEYRLVFTHTCTFLTYYDLVTSLDKTILDQAPELATKGSAQPNIKVKAGQLIGRIGAQTLDFAVWDLQKKLTGFVNLDSYSIADPWKPYTANPFDYTSEEVEKIMIERNLRTTEPIQGKIDYDIAGRLIGNWFREGTNGFAGLKQEEYWRDHLAIVYDYLDPTAVIVSTGNWAGDEKQFSVVGNSPDPATVGVAPQPTKYELLQFNYTGPDGRSWDNSSIVKPLQVAPTNQTVHGTILLQLLESGKLKVENFVGKPAAEVTGFTSAAKIYVR